MKILPKGLGNGYDNMGNGFFNYVIYGKYNYSAPITLGFGLIYDIGNGYHSYPYNLLIKENI